MTNFYGTPARTGAAAAQVQAIDTVYVDFRRIVGSHI